MNARMNVLFATALLGCLVTASGADKPNPQKVMNIQITSTAFSEGQPIPAKYSCEGSDISPPLKWTEARPQTPKASRSSPTIPTRRRHVGALGALRFAAEHDRTCRKTWRKRQTLPGGAKQGLNSWPRLGYGGPCPPPGKPHRYFFKLYALDTMLDLKPGADEEGFAQGDGRPRPRRRAVDGDVSAEMKRET